ncbi:MAG TPA: hypothetical protein VMD77_13225 [Candidatus Baltobacteraceae bacterium]|jgi:hypothetical protein|nr:hypothetical protein [Candidatus Baltobacteraceae bacterium]
MPADLLDLLCKATNEMSEFLRRVKEFAAGNRCVDPSLVKSLTARLRQVAEATRDALPQDVSRARASSVYGNYRELLAEVQAVLKPFQEQLAARQSELGAKRSQVAALRSWASAYQRTR